MPKLKINANAPDRHVLELKKYKYQLHFVAHCLLGRRP
jgi:hypothetical protein